jgi:Carboxypeptidase regulatory-like domain
MKRSFLLVSIIAVLAILINHYLPTESVSAQKMGRSRAVLSDDAELASEIKRLANRSTEDIVPEWTPEGAIRLNSHGRFQNVMLSKVDEDGDLAVGCISSLDEANSFFSRNLETGEKYLSAPKVPKYFAEEAARHGMSAREYQFYTDVIDRWAARQESPESATISIVNGDGAGEGFNDPAAAFVVGEGGNAGATRGAQRLILFQAAADVWDGFIDSSVPILVNSQFNPLFCSGGSVTLGSAGAANFLANHPNAGFANTWHHVALANKQAGVDMDSLNPDINATFNISVDSGCFGGASRFYYGLDNATPAGTINLFAVLLHEIGHGLGFSTIIDSTTGAEPLGFDDVYARFAFDEDAGQTWSAMTTDAARVTSSTNEDDVVWDGANVKIASPSYSFSDCWDSLTGRVELFTPTTFVSGSSRSHFNTDCTPNLLMEPNLNAGLSLDLDLTKQQMRDIGWFRDETANGTADTITGVSLSGTAVIGTNKTISWTNNGGFARNVTIELSTDSGSTFPTAIATNIANTGSFSWTVPNIPTSTARLRVREHNFAAPLGASASNFSILITSAAAVTVWGRVTDAAGNGIPKAKVSLTDNNGSTQTALTNSFGYFLFVGVPSGETYVAAVSHKRYRFTPQAISVVDEVAGLEFVADP